MMCVNLSGFCAEKFSASVLPEESYLILLKSPASAAMVSDTKVLKAEILTTLYNEKNQILLNTLKSGIARLYIASGKEISIIEFNSDKAVNDVEIIPDSKVVKAILRIDTVEGDTPSAVPFELDEPPALRGEH